MHFHRRRQFNYSFETWCLTVALLDRFLFAQPICTDMLQLAGLAAFFVAAKLEEVDAPQLSELVSICARAYSKVNLRTMELILLGKLQFHLLIPTAAFFLNQLVEDERFSDPGWPEQFSERLVHSKSLPAPC